MSIRAVKIIKKVVIWITATVLLHLFINASSPVCVVSFLPYLNIDLSFLIVPMTVLITFLCASSIFSMIVNYSPWKDVMPLGLYGLAISTFIIMFFEWAPVPAFATAILFPLELTVIVLTGSIIAIGLLKRRRRYESLLLALCTGTVAYAVYDTGRALSHAYEPIAYAVLPFTVGLLAVSIGALLGFFRDTNKSLISEISEWISKGPVRNFALGFFLTVYVSFVRPSVEDFPATVIGEWIMIALVVAVILSGAKGPSEELHADARFLDWKKHAREAQRQTGHDFEHLVSAQEKFVNQGIKEPLLVYLTLALNDLGETEERILMTLAPLVQYNDKKPPIWNFPWTKGKLEKENKETRRKLLESLVREMKKEG